MKRMKVCKKLCKWLLDCFDIETSSFKEKERVISIGPDDVVDILGLPAVGSHILTHVRDLDDVCRKYSINSEGGLDINVLKKDLENVSPTSPEFKAKFVLFTVGTFFVQKVRHGPIGLICHAS